MLQNPNPQLECNLSCCCSRQICLRFSLGLHSCGSRSVYWRRSLLCFNIYHLQKFVHQSLFLILIQDSFSQSFSRSRILVASDLVRVPNPLPQESDGEPVYLGPGPNLVQSLFNLQPNPLFSWSLISVLVVDTVPPPAASWSFPSTSWTEAFPATQPGGLHHHQSLTIHGFFSDTSHLSLTSHIYSLLGLEFEVAPLHCQAKDISLFRCSTAILQLLTSQNCHLRYSLLQIK